MFSAQSVQLHLFVPDTDGQANSPGKGGMELNPRMRLSEFFLDYFLPVYLTGARPATVELYRQSVDHWKRLTGDPPLCEVTQQLTAGFLAQLMQVASFKSGKPLAPRTVLHHVDRLNAILTAAGPASKEHEDAAELLLRPPWISTRNVHVPQTLPAGDYTTEEVGQMLRGALKMHRSTYIEGRMTPATFWTIFVAGSYYLGEHRDEMMGIRLADIDDGNHVNVPPRKKTGKLNRKLLHPALATIVRATWSKRVFLLPWRDWHATAWKRARDSRCQFYARFQQLQRISEIAEERRKLGTRGFRKAHLTALADGSFSDAQMSANHADLAVTLGHYVSGLVQTRKRQDTVDRAIGRLPDVRLSGTD